MIADLIASSANILQCSLTGGNFKYDAMSLFVIHPASCNDFPIIHSVVSELDAIALPQPKVLNLASEINPSLFTYICNRITSPHAGAPTKPVPTFEFVLSKTPININILVN